MPHVYRSGSQTAHQVAARRRTTLTPTLITRTVEDGSMLTAEKTDERTWHITREADQAPPIEFGMVAYGPDLKEAIITGPSGEEVSRILQDPDKPDADFLGEIMDELARRFILPD